MTHPTPAPATSPPTPGPAPGQPVWFPEGSLARLRPATVLQLWAGKDGRTWCLLELENGYRALPALSLHASPDGPSYFQLSMQDPVLARAFMQQAGLLDKNGEWMPQFRPGEGEDAEDDAKAGSGPVTGAS